MSERNKRHEEAFKEAEQEWNLSSLYADLLSVKQRYSSHNTTRKYLTSVEKCYLRGLLCYKNTKQIAKAVKSKEGTVKAKLSEAGGLYDYIEILIREKTTEEIIRRWDIIPHYFEKAGYKRETGEYSQAKVSESFLSSLSVSEQPQQNQPICPYLGLSAFREKDAAYFFGREGFTEELLKTVAEKPLLAVIGASGSGKSSVVFAGLIPRLRGEKNWVIVSCRLGNRPFDSLSAALIPEMKLQISEIEQLSQVKKLAEKFRQGELGLQDVVELILQKNSDACRLLLVIDQFEELYALCQSAEERQRFLDELVIAVQVASHQRTPNLTLVITLRADFYGYALSHRPFSDALQGAIANISSMSRQELKDAIEKPAAQASLQFEDGLTQRILKDVSKAPGNLPLLEFTLTQLWEKRRDGKLTHSIYEEIGDVEQALAKYAEEVYRKLNEDEQKRAKQIFIQLVRPGEGTADTRRLATRPQVGEDNWDLVTSLADARLVVSNRDEATGEETVEVVHEALIEGWQRLREWMESEREFRTWQERLRFRMAQWKVSGKDKGELLRGAPLVEAQKWLEEQRDRIPEDEQAFIQASRDYQEHEEQRERELRRQAEISEIEALSLLSQALFPDDQLGALLAAVKAGRKLQGIEVPPALKIRTLARLHQAVYRVQELNRLQGHKASVTSIDFTPDGQILASASEDGTVKLWDLEGNLIKTIRIRHGSRKLLDISFSPDGQILAVANERNVDLLSLSDSKLREFGYVSSFNPKTVSFSPNGQLLASTDIGTLKLWRLDSDEAKTFQDRNVWSVSFSPDGQLLACATLDTLELWSLDGIIQRTFIVKRRGMNSVCFSPDGKRLAAFSFKWIFIWSLDSSEPQIYEHSYVVNTISFSPDGKTIASANSDGTIKLWSLDGDELQTFRGHCTQINKISFSHDGQVLASAGQDGTVRFWSLKSKKLPILRGHSKGINKISFSPDGQMLASASNDGTVKLWNLDGSESKTFQEHNTCVTDVIFTPDGQMLISFCKDDSVNLCNLNGTTLKTFKVEVPCEVYDMALSPDGQTLVVTIDSSYISPFSITLWSINGTLIKTLEEPYIKALSPPIFTSFSPDGRVIACADYYGEVKLYRYDGYECIEELHTFKACNHSVKNVSFSPSGEILALATEGGTVSLWSLDGKELQTFQASRSEVTSVSFSPDGKILASDGDYRAVKLWSIEGSELHTFSGHTGAVNSVSFSPDGQILASASIDGTIILWNLNLDELLVQSCNWLRDYLKTNPNVSESDRHLGDGIGTQK